MSELSPQLRQQIADDATRALREDVGSGDLTAALVPEEQSARAIVIVREPAVVCGQPWFDEIFARLDTRIHIDWAVAEGAPVQTNQRICTVSGPARPVLTGERAALNFLQTLSGTATIAKTYADAVAGSGTRILDTRKTLPGLRLAQKYAVQTGGCDNHRIGLYDGILIKENHIIAAGGIARAVDAARRLGHDALVEVEVESPDEAEQAMAAGADRLLLDNFDLAGMTTVVGRRDAAYPGITLEASGGVDLSSITDIAATGVDFISVGGLTKNLRAIDFSMRFELS